MDKHWCALTSIDIHKLRSYEHGSLQVHPLSAG